MKYYFSKADQFVSPKAKKFIEEHCPKADFSALEEMLTGPLTFDSDKSWNDTVQNLIATVKENVKGLKAEKTEFTKEMKDIARKAALIEPTPWGGVVYKKVDIAKNFINKLLVIQQYGILGFEYHKKKLERLDCTEGIFMMFYCNHAAENFKKGQVFVKIIAPGDHLSYDVLDEHGLVALTDGILAETSTNNLDDLIFIYNSVQVI